MELVRFADKSGAVHVGVDRDGVISLLPAPTLADLLKLAAQDIRDAVETSTSYDRSRADVLLLPPVDGRTEVWAAGVTYARSRNARMEESLLSQVYELVDRSERPEVFFKSVPWKVVTHLEPISVRRDSPINAPEAELALVVNAFGEIVGFSVFNDVSSRSIEGENPLYLPQAKIYAGSCAIGNSIRPAWDVNPNNLSITIQVLRGGEVAWQETSSTSRIRRKFESLVAYLFREEIFPHGAILATGTDAIPPLDFTLTPDDIVTIEIEQVGRLTNPVVSGKSSYDWLAEAANGAPRNWAVPHMPPSNART